ncbi:helix-turn-helix transcriptional regulator [Streptomyces sp. NPDC007346]|uniref:helix-turn-helix domain-containing protein n=1 Tax=Streptomyces sp. NPDC007346 TaxID=3154682 RepID=UPI0034520A09
MNDQSRPEPPTEAALIARAQKRSGLSGRKAASLAGISDARWRQIIHGYQTISGTRLPVSAPDGTLARMASVVGVTPDQLREAGRPDAADELEQMTPPAPPRPAGQYTPPLDAITAIMASLSVEEQAEVIRRLGHDATHPQEGEPEHQHRRAG